MDAVDGCKCYKKCYWTDAWSNVGKEIIPGIKSNMKMDTTNLVYVSFRMISNIECRSVGTICLTPNVLIVSLLISFRNKALLHSAPNICC